MIVAHKLEEFVILNKGQVLYFYSTNKKKYKDQRGLHIVCELLFQEKLICCMTEHTFLIHELYGSAIQMCFVLANYCASLLSFSHYDGKAENDGDRRFFDVFKSSKKKRKPSQQNSYKL